MKQWHVILTRDITESADVFVDAADEESAIAIAYERHDAGKLRYEPDDTYDTRPDAECEEVEE